MSTATPSSQTSTRSGVVRNGATPSGLVVIDKPDGMTSHDVVAKVRRILGTRKVGHAGTLDPMATGILVLGIERATKLLGHLALDTKTYLSTIRLGASTVTDDAEGDVLTSHDASTVAEQDIRAGIAKLTGEITQVPSAVSAVKINGQRAYERVRRGEAVEIAARPVTVYRFDILTIRRVERFTELDVMVECSSGTYVRALARDLGADLGVGGHLSALRRTRVGPFDLRLATTLTGLTDKPELSCDLTTAVELAFPRYDLGKTEAIALAQGQIVPAADLPGVYGVFGPDGQVIALAKDVGPIAKSLVVLQPAG